MKFYIFFITIINILYMSSLVSCPFGFSPHDQRPFFEQYEIKTNQPTPQK